MSKQMCAFTLDPVTIVSSEVMKNENNCLDEVVYFLRIIEKKAVSQFGKAVFLSLA